MGSTLESTTIPNIFAQGDAQINGNYPNYPNQNGHQGAPHGAAHAAAGGIGHNVPYGGQGALAPVMQWLWTESATQEYVLVLVYSLILWTVYKVAIFKVGKWRAGRSAPVAPTQSHLQTAAAMPMQMGPNPMPQNKK